MLERAVSEASAFALDRRNFDYLPDSLALAWRAAFLNAKRRAVPGPRRLIVEILNTCNLDCPMCRVGRHGVDLSRRMPLEVFEDLLRQVDTVETVRLNGLGESTLLPDFGSYVAVLAEHRLGVELISNGTGDLSHYALVAEASGHIFISWDASRPSTFEQLRRPASWSDLKARLEQIASRVDQSGRGRCSLIFTLQKANIGQFRGVVQLAAKLGLHSVQLNVAKTPTISWLSAGMDAIWADIGAAHAVADASGIVLHIPAEIDGHMVPGGRPAASSGCTAPWDEAVVRWNGDVQACNMFNPYIYGNIHRHAFEAIWRNAFAEVFRLKLNGTERHPYCVGCAYMSAAYLS